MARSRAADVVFWILAAVTLALLVVFLLVLFGGIAIESTAERPVAARTTEPPARTAAEAPRATPQTTKAQTTKTRRGTPAKAPARPATVVVLTAARGDCWIQARNGSPEGRVLDERVLSQGESVSLEGTRIWLAVGAAGNLDVTVNGKAQPLSPGTISVLISESGLVRS